MLRTSHRSLELPLEPRLRPQREVYRKDRRLREQLLVRRREVRRTSHRPLERRRGPESVPLEHRKDQLQQVPELARLALVRQEHQTDPLRLVRPLALESVRLGCQTDRHPQGPGSVRELVPLEPRTDQRPPVRALPLEATVLLARELRESVPQGLVQVQGSFFGWLTIEWARLTSGHWFWIDGRWPWFRLRRHWL
ncbi:MAG: hypothetical protein R3C05_22150 [Pirellulaceae bacterium]